MPQSAVEFHPLAADEAKAAERWYRERNEAASGRFQRELDRAPTHIVTIDEQRMVIGGEYGGLYLVTHQSDSGWSVTSLDERLARPMTF